MVLLVVYSVLLLMPLVAAFPRHLLYTYGSGYDQQLPREDDVSSPEFQLAVPIVFFGDKYTSIFVNANGLLSFQTEIPIFLNIQFPLNYPIIAPLYTNVDIRSSGTISYRETQDPAIIARATRNVKDYFSNANSFEARSVFVATWADVGYHNNGSDKLNTFQVAIISDGEDSYVEFLYPENGIEWIQGTGGESGLPDARAQAGLISIDRNMYTLPGSGTDKVYQLMKRTNMNSPGQWIFHVGKVENVDQPDLNNQVESNQQVNGLTCVEASSQCHSKAKCVDYDDGFCCICQDAYYGNGKSCVKNDVPLRVNGKVNGVLNGIPLENLDLQSYIVMSDGRAYTAISRVPREVGFSVQTLQILGGLIGFLFAKPIGDVKNGYQITGGVFNHSADIKFYNGAKAEIYHTYLGLDVFDQLRLEVNIKGSVPEITQDIKLVLPDYEEHYTISSPGTIRSHSTHSYRNADTNEEYQYTIEQNLQYNACKYADSPDSSSWRVKVSKNFISYESREQIIRFGMSNKVAPLTDIDPCKEGSKFCGIDSSCIVEGDSYRCVCNQGYQYIYNDDNSGMCVDINECQVGLHNCDINAQCVNELGKFNCQCNSGFKGDGISCRNIRTCADIRCGENAECVDDEEPRCYCSPGFIGDGRICIVDKRHTCDVVNNCSPFGYCDLNDETDQYECFCASEYEGNGYVCEPISVTTETIEVTTDRAVEKCLLGICWCPDGFEKDPDSIYCFRKQVTKPVVTTVETPSVENVLAQPIPECFNSTLCICPWGYKYEQNDNACFPIPGMPHDTMGPTGKNISCNIINKCHPHAQCIFVSHAGNYQCQCNAGYEGDGNDCIINDISCVEVDICDIHASCMYEEELRKSICVCNPGYQGDGTFCEPAAQCRSHTECKENEDCSFSSLTQRYECACREGFERDASDLCTKLKDTCGGGTCVDNAECLYDSEYQTYYCQCNPEFVGDGITECKPRPLGCDSLNNCGLHASCIYEHALAMYQCQCNDRYYGDGFLCSAQKTCHADPYICDIHASCIVNSERQYICECNLGYTGNGTVCKVSPKHEGNFLLLNQGMATLRVPFNPTPKNPGRPIQIQYYQMAIGLDVDCYEGRVYWSDITGKAIKSSAYNGTNYMDFLTSNIGSPEGLSIDWVSRNIYWTDSSKDTLEVANLDTKLRKVLFSDNLVNPRGIAVHPQRGKIFWSDWDRRSPKIEWANMDGTNREIFLQGSPVQLPNSLAIDWETDQLCYADAGTKNIDCVEIDTRRIRTIAANCTYPFGLAISENHFYWTDWVSQKIESVDKTTLIRQTPIKVPLGGSGNKLYGMAAVPEQCPGLTNSCQFYNGQCSPGHLCLPSGTGRRSCICAKDMYWTGVAVWRWVANDDSCGICRMAFDGCCPDCKLPGDDCPLVWGQCSHCFHMHCIVKWLHSQQVNQQCPMCRQEWKFNNK